MPLHIPINTPPWEEDHYKAVPDHDGGAIAFVCTIVGKKKKNHHLSRRKQHRMDHKQYRLDHGQPFRNVVTQLRIIVRTTSNLHNKLHSAVFL